MTDLAMRMAIRTELFRVLSTYPIDQEDIDIGKLFLQIADSLSKKNIIPLRSDRAEFVSLYRAYHTVSFPDFGIPSEIASLIRLAIWEAYRQDIIAPVPNKRNFGAQQIHHFLDIEHCLITPHGRKVLSSSGDQIAVYDPEEYLNIFWSLTPSPDEEMMRYLAECVQVFRGHHFLATIVLLGAASERLIDVLATHVRDAMDVDGQDWYRAYSKEFSIAAKFKKIENKLSVIFINTKAIDTDWSVIKLNFEYIRRLRNDIAHDHNFYPTWSEVAGLLHNFVLYFRCIQSITSQLIAKSP